MTDEQNPVTSPPADNLQQENPAASGTVGTGTGTKTKTGTETTGAAGTDSPAQPSPAPSSERSPADPVPESPLESTPEPASESTLNSTPESTPESAPEPASEPVPESVQEPVPASPEPEAAGDPEPEPAHADIQSPLLPAEEAGRTEGTGGTKGAETEAAEGTGGAKGAETEATPLEEPKRPSSGLFKKYITENKIFKNREVLRHSYSPRELPHRDEQIDSIAEILAPALQGATPSNILIYGKTGTGKTATVKYVGGELENESSGFTPCRLIHLNCETIDTQYRVLAQIANCVSEIDNKASDRVKNTIPPTGWHTDQVYSELKNILEHAGGLQIIVLDEIDKLVKKSGDDTLYSLTRINSDLTKSRVCIIGISNDLTFKDFLDPRVLSSLSEEELVFPPYNAAQLADILKQRAGVAFLEGAVSDDVISLCAARAAQEHGDARRALDLLRVSGELAEREGASHVEERHVATAQESIETDTMSECVKTLPVQSKIVLSSMLLLAGSGQKVFTSGQVVGIYRDLVKELDVDCLSHRRVSELINDLTMLGIVSSRVVSYGRHGRTTEIYFDKPTNEIRRVIMNESRFMECSILESLMR